MASLTSPLSFDLESLYLQEDEYHFQDIPCSFTPSSALAVEDGAPAADSGTLKICSSSVYLVPHDTTQPLVRLPLDAIISCTLG